MASFKLGGVSSTTEEVEGEGETVFYDAREGV